MAFLDTFRIIFSYNASQHNYIWAIASGINLKSQTCTHKSCLFLLDLSFDRWFTSLAFLLSRGQTRNLSVSHQMSILKAFSTCSLSQALPSPFQRRGLGDTASVGTGRCHLSSETHNYTVTSHLPCAIYLVPTHNVMFPSHWIIQAASYNPVWILNVTAMRTMEAHHVPLPDGLVEQERWSRCIGECNAVMQRLWRELFKRSQIWCHSLSQCYTELWFRLFRFNTNLYRLRASTSTLDTSSTSPSFTGVSQR